MRERILAICERIEAIRLELAEGVIIVAGGEPADGVCLAFGYGVALAFPALLFFALLSG
jgi:hypothetical protein